MTAQQRYDSLDSKQRQDLLLKLGETREEAPRNTRMALTCEHCGQVQIVQVRARSDAAQASPQSVPCVKCKQDFDVMVPDQIIGGPFFP